MITNDFDPNMINSMHNCRQPPQHTSRLMQQYNGVFEQQQKLPKTPTKKISAIVYNQQQQAKEEHAYQDESNTASSSNKTNINNIEDQELEKIRQNRKEVLASINSLRDRALNESASPIHNSKKAHHNHSNPNARGNSRSNDATAGSRISSRSASRASALPSQPVTSSAYHSGVQPNHVNIEKSSVNDINRCKCKFNDYYELSSSMETSVLDELDSSLTKSLGDFKNDEAYSSSLDTLIESNRTCRHRKTPSAVPMRQLAGRKHDKYVI